jgi:hypothetical protein
MHPPQRTQRSKSTATVVGSKVASPPIRRATSRITGSAADSKGVTVAPSIARTVSKWCASSLRQSVIAAHCGSS